MSNPSFMAEPDSEADDRLTRRRQRTIAALTDQQLQHKRNLDRKAQHTLRQRNKSRIEDLEQELVKFKLSKTTHETESSRRIAILQDQNRILSRRLEQIGRLTIPNHLHGSLTSRNGAPDDGFGKSVDNCDRIIGTFLTVDLEKASSTNWRSRHSA